MARFHRQLVKRGDLVATPAPAVRPPSWFVYRCSHKMSADGNTKKRKYQQEHAATTQYPVGYGAAFANPYGQWPGYGSPVSGPPNGPVSWNGSRLFHTAARIPWALCTVSNQFPIVLNIFLIGNVLVASR